MVKQFQVVIAPPPQGIFVPGSDVTGHLLLVTDEAKSSYSRIVVTLKVYAHVHWSEEHGSGDDRRTDYYTGHEDFVNRGVVLWTKATATGGQLPAGSYQFPFSIRLDSDGKPFPLPFEGAIGRIRYEVEGMIVKSATLKFNTRHTVSIPFTVAVDPNTHPNAREPKMLQVQKTLCCLCCASGPIDLSGRITRSGFCNRQDAVSFEADVENGSNRDIQRLRGQIVVLIRHIANGGRQNVSTHTIGEVTSNLIAAHNQLSWRPPPIPIPEIMPSIETSSVLRVEYYLKVQAVISFAINPHLDFPILIGNIPLTGIETTGYGQPSGSAPTLPTFLNFQPQPQPQATPYPDTPAVVPYPSGPAPTGPPPPYSGPPQAAYGAPPPAAFSAPPPPSMALPPGFVDPIKRR